MFEVMDPALRKAGKSAIYCTSCGNHLSRSEQILYVSNGMVHPECDMYGDFQVKVLPSSSKFMRSGEIPGSIWWHSTNRFRWMSDILESPSMPIVHVGSRYAALDRAKHEKYSHLFKVRVDFNTSIDPEIRHDICDGWSPYAEDWDYDVTRYVNMWESPGSISLLVKPTSVTVVDQRLL